ncbi:MAG: DUF4291 domain-containing protein [Oscillospiraceae bacterium]|nr:DUF4291 domain-containing protein [Oscillospiraceae bacterium]
MNQQEIRAVYNEHTIRVYQAFRGEIAQEAVQSGTFGPHFKMDRMTWIKPSFLWMMYRCGWAEKEGQEHVLGIDVRRSAFDKMVREAVESAYRPDSGITREEWQRQIKTSQLRCQWDPERDIYGNPLPYRSLQLGLRGEAVYHYVHSWIMGITDLTEYVRDLNGKRRQGMDILPLLPQERTYIIGNG